MSLPSADPAPEPPYSQAPPPPHILTADSFLTSAREHCPWSPVAQGWTHLSLPPPRSSLPSGYFTSQSTGVLRKMQVTDSL